MCPLGRVGSLSVTPASVCVSALAAWPSGHLPSRRSRQQPGRRRDPLGVGELAMFSFLAPRGRRTASLLPEPGPTRRVPSRSLDKVKVKVVSRRKGKAQSPAGGPVPRPRGRGNRGGASALGYVGAASAILVTKK